MKIVRRLVAGRHLKTLRREDASPQDLAEAAEQLASGGAAILPALFEALHDRVARARAREILAEILDDETLGAYLDALESDDVLVVETVTEVLSSSTRYDPAPLLAALPAAGASRPRLETVLQARGAELPLRKLLPTLEDPENPSRDVVFRLVDTHGDASMVPHVTRMLDNEDVWVRTRAVHLLSRFPNEQSLAGLTRALRDPSPVVRLEAVKTLGDLACTDAIPDLAGALRDRDLKVHAAAIDALMAIGDAEAVPYLVEVLKDESEYARRGAVEVLNEVATIDAIKDLVRALQDADWWVRVRAADALGSLGGERVVDALIELLEAEDDFIRRYAVEILITVHDARAVEPLIAKLRDPDWWVRERAIDALAKIGDARAVEPLIDVMVVDPDASPLCARALGHFADERAVDPLCQLASSGTEEQSQEAISALQLLARAELSPERRKHVRETLGALGAKAEDSRLTPMRTTSRSASAPAPTSSQARHHEPPGAPPPLPPRPLPPQDRTIAVDDAGMSGSPGGASPPPPGPAPPAEKPKRERPLNVGALESGQVLNDRYRVVRKIGSGGFGSVYLVEDTTVNDELILKILSPHISEDETVIKRFVHELKYTRRITHRNVIRLFDFIDLNGAHAISMEYFPGLDLSRLIRKQGALGSARTVAIACQICEGLTAAHQEGIIHRDIKPPNVLVGEKDTVKIVDFGLASMAQNAGSQLTRSGIIIGTPQYMAPEQITGDKTDARTDIYALGVVMFEMLTGTQPFQAENAVNVLFQHLEQPVPSIREKAPDVPEELEALVGRVMEKDRQKRPQSAQDLHEMLRALSPQPVDE